MPLATEIFALDIGTRSVVGVVGVREEGELRVVASAMAEHSTRAMLDGQIHDIAAVSTVVARIKERLEAAIGHPLQEVAVAAAGRALRTMRGHVAMETFSLAEISRQQVLELELAAVQQAQMALSEDEADATFYQCVGYSVVEYKLDGSALTSLVSHRGSQIEVQLIATFLPRSVVDSLYSVLKICNLNMRSLTLEPIAAISVAIPASMRTLNLVLVDIGAGTSDIALVSNGAIQNYAMVPMAGDEITEFLCSQYLLDFNCSEQVKRSLMAQPSVAFQDVLGMQHEVASAQILASILPAVQTLATAIATKILELNSKPPAAVILIGGGSLTPQLPQQIAIALNLPEQRVAVRGRELVDGLVGDLSGLQGPAGITPLGIALTSVTEQALSLLHVEVNDLPVRLFSLKQAKVADALLAAGVNLRKLHGKPGMALAVSVNGQLCVIKGEMGISAEIRCNGHAVDFETLLKPGDHLEVTPARDGAPARATVRDVVPKLQQFKVSLNGTIFTVTSRIILNGSLVPPTTTLEDRAEIVCRPISTLADLLDYLQVDPPTEHEMNIKLNARNKVLAYTEGILLLNGQPATVHHPVHPGDNVELLDEVTPRWRVRDVLPTSTPSFVDISLNGQPRSLPGSRPTVKLNDKVAYGDEPLQNGDRLEYTTPKPQLILTDLFKYLDFQATPPPGKSRLIMEINDQPAKFVSSIISGDKVSLQWV
ncbi:MAG: rod shape-determining protein [Peptococcaceae bacterium]|nr:rod shape-determining protein [Peptococcaceae bacterium]